MKIKLRDLTKKQYREWEYQNCNNKITNCEKCIFDNVRCDSYLNCCWINHKELYSETFLNQEIEVEGEILTDKERECLSVVIKPFRDRIMWIKKHDYLLSDDQYIQIMLNNDTLLLPIFEENKYYKNMEVDKEYTLEELGL